MWYTGRSACVMHVCWCGPVKVAISVLLRKAKKKKSLNEDVLRKVWTFRELIAITEAFQHDKRRGSERLERINITSHAANTDHTHAATRPCQLSACLCTGVWGKSQSVNHFRHALWLKQNIKQQAGTFTNSTTPGKKQYSLIGIQTVFPPFE